MASTCTINKGSRQIGTGSVAAGSASVTSFTLTDAVYNTRVHGSFGRNVVVTITEAGTHLGRSFPTRITADNGSGTLTLRDVCPFVGA
jgi:hypothetical protein